MTTINQTVIKKDLANKKLFVVREFDAPVDLVWRAWTDTDLLDLWWAPKPWRAKTKTMDFREGGFWLYCMVGPEGEQHWCRLDYETIVPQKKYIAVDSFCDENGNKTSEIPSMHWKNDFYESNGSTKVEVEITFQKIEDLHTIVEMGFEEGFTMAHGNLDELLERETNK